MLLALFAPVFAAASVVATVQAAVAAPAAATAQAPAAAPCVDPAAYGAVPDDHGDDSPAFQRAIAHAIEIRADVCIGPGVWNLARPAGHPGSVEVNGGPVAIRGAGPRSVLRMSGPGHHRDWRMLYLRNAHDVVIRDLTVDGLDAVDTEEQTHLVELGPDTHDVVIARVTFGPMRRPDQRVGEGIGGDCLRLLGEPGHEVASVTVADSQFVDCDRSGIGFQRALRDIALVRDTITGTGDSAIDFEPTGRGAIDDVAMVGLTIRHPAAAQSTWAIAIAGIDQDLARRVVVEQSTIDGGGIAMLNVEDVELADNAITAHPGGADRPTISMFRHAERVRIVRNTISRPATADPGFVIRAAHNNGAIPGDIAIEDNTIVQGTPYSVIGTLSTSRLTIRHNVIDYTAHDLGAAIVLASPEIADIAGLTVEDNEVRGSASALVIGSLRQQRKLSGVSVRGNRSSHLAALRCNGAAAGFSGIRLDEPLPEHTGCIGVAIQIAPMTPAGPAAPPAGATSP